MGIQAIGTSCTTARHVASDATGENNGKAYSSGGFTCAPHQGNTTGLYVAAYICIGGSATVTFTAPSEPYPGEGVPSPSTASSVP
jgi:hypothetical protein